MTLTLHQLEASPFCDKVRRVLRYKRLPFTAVDHPIVGLRRASPRTGKLPVLEAAGEFIDDSTQIALWLEDRFPERSLVPGDPVARARCLALEDWADESLYYYEIALHYLTPANARSRTGRLVRGEGRGARAALQHVMAPALRLLLRLQGTGRRSREIVLADVARHFETVSSLASECGWLVGAGVTLADIAVFSQIELMTATPEGAAIAARFPEMRAWAARVRHATGGAAAGQRPAPGARDPEPAPGSRSTDRG